MHSIYDEASAAAVLTQPLTSALASLLTERLSDALAMGLADQTHILVIESGDTEEDILQEIGWSPLSHPTDGHRYGTADFTPYWAWLGCLGGWYELLHIVGNSGFAYILLIERSEGVLSALSTMCDDGARSCAC